MDTIKTNKFILTEQELHHHGVWDEYAQLRQQLYKADQRKDCILIQGAAFVIEGKAFLVVGVGGIHFLDSLAQMDGVDGVIGNSNTIFLSKDFSHVYSAHTPDELVERYQIFDNPKSITFIDGAPLVPLIFLLRSFYDQNEYNQTKEKMSKLLFEEENTFAGEPIRYAGKIKARLRKKFIDTCRIAHCTYRPILYKKECLFDSHIDVYEAINKFRGHFALLYSVWRQDISDAYGVSRVRKLAKGTYNPTDAISPHFLHMAKRFV